MAITQQTDYLGEGIGRLIEQYKGRPRMASLLKAWLTEVQAVESAMWEVFVDRLLQSNLAFGDLLIKLGQIVGQGSEGQTDAGFRLLISARILANRSSGRREQLLQIAELLIPGASILFKVLQPKALTITSDLTPTLPPALITNSFLGRAKAAGDRLDFIWPPQLLADTLLNGDIGGGFMPTAFQSPGDAQSAPFGGGHMSSVIPILGGP